MTPQLTDMQTARGNPVRLAVRDGTSDLSVAFATMRPWGGPASDEYRLADISPLSGVALDIGAHIGTVSMALLADHPDLHVIAVEPLAENVECIRQSAEANGWTDRITILEAAVGDGPAVTVRWGAVDDSEFARTNAYIGDGRPDAPGSLTIEVPAVTLTTLVGLAGGSVAFLKVDCEGGEWSLLADPAIAHVERIAGEWHGVPGAAGVRALLDPTHDVDAPDGEGEGLFFAVRHDRPAPAPRKRRARK